jgi:hypothetical protein
MADNTNLKQSVGGNASFKSCILKVRPSFLLSVSCERMAYYLILFFISSDRLVVKGEAEALPDE